VLWSTLCTSCRQPTNNTTGDSEQAGLAELSNAASKRKRLDSEIDPNLPELARRASERRDHILQNFTTLDQLSDPVFHTKLPFPFVGTLLPRRFKVDPGDDNDKWFYTGRERFKELLEMFRDVRLRRNRSALWVYGTKGYGKSHLLAAFVCYLAAQKERVVYIPDCRECIRSPVLYVRAAMLFAWADDKTIQEKIIMLDTKEEICDFFEHHQNQNVIFVIDQMNALADLDEDDAETRNEKGKVRKWLTRCRAGYKAVLSASANYKAYLQSSVKESTEDTMHVYGGFTAVSLTKFCRRTF